MFTIKNMAQRLKTVGVNMPCPLPKTVRNAKNFNITLPCTLGLTCSLGYECSMCDAYVAVKGINNPAKLNEYLVSDYLEVRNLARYKYSCLIRGRSGGGGW